MKNDINFLLSKKFESDFSPLIIGYDKWSLEKYFPAPFFWLSPPFSKSKASAFITPETKIKKNFKELLIIDLDSFEILYEEWFYLKQKIFYASQWTGIACGAATFSSDILYCENDKIEYIKKNNEMQPW